MVERAHNAYAHEAKVWERAVPPFEAFSPFQALKTANGQYDCPLSLCQSLTFPEDHQESEMVLKNNGEEKICSSRMAPQQLRK